MADTFNVEIIGIEKIENLAAKFPEEVRRNMLLAAQEAADKLLLPSVGLQKYPPETAANRPPVPYYERGSGTITGKGSNGKSENMKARWYTRPYGKMGLEVGNRASYARYVHGEQQAQHMGKNARIPKGWRILVEVAKEKTPGIIKIFHKWIEITIKKLLK